MTDVAVDMTMQQAFAQFVRINAELPQVDLKTTHVVNGGIYARTVYIPAGVSVVGAKHKTDATHIICGDVTIASDEGPVRLAGVQVIPSGAGSRRAVLAHTDTVWTTCWRTDLTDIAAIEDELTDESEHLQTRQLALNTAAHEALEA